MPAVDPRDCKRRTYDWKSRAGRASDYAYARMRLHSQEAHSDPLRYERARELMESISTKRKKERQSLAEAFREQVQRWKRETGHLSSLRKAVAHPSYLRIIGLANESSGFEIERLLLHELEAEPDHWFPALTAITGENPVNAEHDFDDAVAAWLDWGRAKGII